jgi:dolichyl-phosphate-mannose-protein mannosyltransferase
MRRACRWALPGAVLVSSALLMLPGVWGHSATFVEVAHLPAGLAAWQRHALGLYRVCGPASKFLYALPAYLAGARVNHPDQYDADVERRKEWAAGRSFQQGHRQEYRAIYRWSRLLPALVTVLGGFLIWEWSTRLFGGGPGLVSLCAWCWMPPVLGYGPLVTSDSLAAVTLLLAARWFWGFLLAPRPATAALAGLALGLAVGTKFTALVLYPCWALLLMARAVGPRDLGGVAPPGLPARAGRLVALGAAGLLVSVVVIDALYLFQGVGFRLPQWSPRLSSAARPLSRLEGSPWAAWLFRVPVPLPLELARGLDFQLADTERPQSAYLLGRTRLDGWWYWYAAAALIKIPLPVMALLALALVRRPEPSGDRAAVLWAALCVLIPAVEVVLAIAASTGTGTNAAFRYVIPTLGLLCVWLGQAWDGRSRWRRSATAGLLAWLLLNAVTGLPDHLGWRNELGQLCSRDRPALIGDSLDWGQDLGRLARWISRHARDGSTLVCVYGLGEAEPYGIGPPAALPPSYPWERSAYLAVSENILFGYESDNCVDIGRARVYLDQNQRRAILRLRPFEWVGRTIRIYRLSDLASSHAEALEK